VYAPENCKRALVKQVAAMQKREQVQAREAGSSQTTSTASSCTSMLLASTNAVLIDPIF
jgi:hypothetical protein